ncbi:TonB-dependent receptor [Allosphingosinicella sp.]|jgi:outer membrane receptor protein involved in Fe transport|uniref:TonB-dependent receptor n=1 Tax=Allosphingosinicella sp. TaxID=2823234 RepID=UPI002F08D03C
MRFSSAAKKFAGLGLLTTTMLCTSGTAFAQEEQAQPAVEEAASPQSEQDPDIIVTATRRAENLQDVPIAITAMGTQTLEELQVDEFNDYARLVPSLSFRSLGPGSANVYFRGVASGENANHSASLPSVGTYLDEQPITTITGALDLHVFDIARIEALAGPQGTLYGASSQAGTVRIITNRPDPSRFYGEVGLEGNSVAHGGFGGTLEGFVNAPLSAGAALRIVGWYRRDAGYIDNVPGTLVFPTSGITFDNSDLVEEDYNDVDTYGARAALGIELDENWTVTPSLMGQRQLSRGSFTEESGLEPLQVSQFNPERFNDRWYQAALTIEGRIGNFDMTYAGAYMQRQINGQFDYVDYAYFYDALAGYGDYFRDNDGDLVNPNQYIVSDDSFRRMSHELRFTSPADRPVRLVAGVFYQRQSHSIEQNYIIDDIADAITVPGTESNIWLTQQMRIDRDYGLFGELAWDIVPDLTLTGGLRLYRFDNTLTGFFGYSDGFSGSTGVAGCFGPPSVPQSPCQNLGEIDADGNVGPKRSEDTDFIHRLNITYRITPDHLVYATWSRGYRPGGVNRRGTLPPYGADFINNYELGLKTSWMDNRLRFNTAIYQLNWDNIQLSFLGANGLTEIQNAGNARIRGAEFELAGRPADGLTFSLGGAYNHAETTNEILAPAGTRLPLTARFKGNARVRYEFPLGSRGMEGHVQLTASHEGRRTRDLRAAQQAIYGPLRATNLVDVSVGARNEAWSFDLFARNLFDARGALGSSINCNEFVCGDPDGVTAIGPKIYTFVATPRTIGIRVGRRF